MPGTTVHAAPRSARPAPPPVVSGGLPVLGHGMAFGKDPLGFLRACQRQYGDVFTVRFPQGPRTFLLDPLDHPAYFKNRDMNFAEVGAEIGGRAFGYALEDARRADIEEISHQINVYMKGEPLQVMSERMQQKLVERLRALPVGVWREDTLHRWANEFVFAAGTDALFGDGVYSEALKQAYTTVDKAFGFLAMGVPARLVPPWARAQRALAARVRDKGPHHAELFDVRHEHLRKLDMLDFVGPFDAGLMWAAQANTVSAAFWTMLYILRDRRARAEILEEVRSVSGGSDLLSPSGAPFSRHDLKNMVKLESAVTEMNRLTTAPMVPRRALEDTTLELRSGTYRFDAGHDLALFPPTTHLDPEIYEDPYDFRFDRFLPDSSGAPARFWKEGQRVHFNLLPFGAGVSMCPGRFFAINEFKIAVAVLLSCFDIELLTTAVPKQDVSRTGFGTLPPVDDVPFRYRRRA